MPTLLVEVIVGGLDKVISQALKKGVYLNTDKPEKIKNSCVQREVMISAVIVGVLPPHRYVFVLRIGLEGWFKSATAGSIQPPEGT